MKSHIKTVIRKRVFETNSSSMHSITLADKDGIMDVLTLDEDGITLTVDCDYDFGWERTTYNDPTAKIAYCVADDVNPELIDEVLKYQTGAKVIHYLNEGNIDHESNGTARYELTTFESLRTFLFNHNSILEVDNDN